jgi:hypothetical protein
MLGAFDADGAVLKDGCVLGAIDGLVLGTKDVLGIELGTTEIDGMPDGTRDMVGWLLIVGDALIDGAALGRMLGEVDGASEGEILGDSLGDSDGEELGTVETDGELLGS